MFRFYCEDLLPDFIFDSIHVRELMDCLAVILMDEFINFFPTFSDVLLVIRHSESLS